MKKTEMISQITQAIKACQDAFRKIEEHENTLDKRITALEERIARLE